jgi:hypothetical protein
VALCRLLQNSAFGPDEIKRMTTAYEDVLRVLGLVDRTDAITEIVAKKVIEITQTGERDPLRIRARALRTLEFLPCWIKTNTRSEGDHGTLSAVVCSRRLFVNEISRNPPS